MPRISLDDGLGRDPRLDHLAELCGWSRREAGGCLALDVWPICYDRVTPNIPARDLNIAAARFAITPCKHPQGFVGALIEAGFARPATRADISFEWVRKGQPTVVLYWHDREWRDRIYMNGAAERIAYLVKSEESGRTGGLNSAKTRGKKVKAPSRDPQGSLKGPVTDPQGSGNPPDTATAPDSASASAPDTPTATAPDPHSPDSPSGAERVVVTWDDVLGNFTERYKAAYGASPIWGRQLGVLKQLVVDHGLAEVYRRTNILFEAPPEFLRKSPCDIGTLKANWNKLVRPTERKPSGGDNLAYL